ncbi:hypothetical protein DL98DRAFT_592364 [Cadophora sp. DSE1049]|nr:hypothetical protein DL98DRAFT_592364 [Cadophora sp. DSE1049]
MLLAIPLRILKPPTTHSIPNAIYLGTFVGHDNHTYKVWANFEAVDDLLRIRLAKSPTGEFFPLNEVHGLKVLEIIEYRASLKQGWARFLDDTGKTWKQGNAQRGRKARLNFLKGLWLVKNNDPRTGRPAIFEEVFSDDDEDVMEPERQVEYIEGTSITESDEHIIRNCFQKFDRGEQQCSSALEGRHVRGSMI